MDLYYADPAQHLKAAGEELDHLDSDLSVQGTIIDDLDHLSDASVPGVNVPLRSCFESCVRYFDRACFHHYSVPSCRYFNCYFVAQKHLVMCFDCW